MVDNELHTLWSEEYPVPTPGSLHTGLLYPLAEGGLYRELHSSGSHRTAPRWRSSVRRTSLSASCCGDLPYPDQKRNETEDMQGFFASAASVLIWV